MIKIISGWGHIGGSTVAFINLCNALNKIGVDCRMYAPHAWFLDKCKTDHLNNLKIEPEDSIIVHFINSANLPPTKKAIFSCHEKNIFPLKDTNYKQYNYLHFVSQSQKDWHGIDHPSFILPNLLDELKISESKPEKIGGVVGSIDVNKQTHVSIMKAIQAGMKKILLYGAITDKQYYQYYVEPLIKKFKGKIEYKGMENNKQKMYDSISDCFLFSKSETWGYIPLEAEMTGTKFHGNGITNVNLEKRITNQEIINKWLEILELQKVS